MALTHILETILDCEVWIFTPEDINQLYENIPKEAVLVLSDVQVPYLGSLRLNGYQWPVFTLSNSTYHQTEKQYAILRKGLGSHSGCDFPFQLLDMLGIVPSLVPMHHDNLQIVQQELLAPFKWIGKIHSILASKNHIAIADLESLMKDIHRNTLSACHQVVTVNGQEAQIQEHFWRLIQRMKEYQAIDDELKQEVYSVFEEWSNKVMEIGEGFGKLDFLK